VTAKAINNQTGLLASASNLTVDATALNNADGQIQADGDAAIRLGGAFDNRGGLIGIGQTLTLTANSLDNRNTLEKDALGIHAGTLALISETLVNRLGHIRGLDDADLAIADTLDNREGNITTGQDLNIRAAELFNTQGALLAGRDLSLTTRALPDGQFISQRDLSLNVQESITNFDTLSANRVLTLISAGQLDNHGQIHAAHLDLRAADIHNAADAEIASAGLTSLAAQGSISNDGRIDGAFTWLSAAEIHNLGGWIGGDDLAITADLLHNGSASGADSARSGTLAANQYLNLGIGVLHNHAGSRISSGGEIAIGGALDGDGRATGFAQSIHNTGLISSDGRFALNAAHLHLGEGALMSGQRIGVDVLGTIGILGAEIVARDALTDSRASSAYASGKRWSRTTSRYDETLHGSLFQAGSDITFSIGRDLTLTAAEILSDTGQITLSAGRDLNLLSGEERHDFVIDESRKKKKLFSSKRTATHDEWHD